MGDWSIATLIMKIISWDFSDVNLEHKYGLMASRNLVLASSHEVDED